MSRGVFYDSGPIMDTDRLARGLATATIGRCVYRYPWGERGRCIMPARYKRGHWHPNDGSSNVFHLDEEGNQW